MGNKPACNSRIHQAYNQMVEDAISALKDRPGSTQNDVLDYLENKYEGRIPPRAKKNLETVLRSVIKTKNVATSRRGPGGGAQSTSSRGPGRKVRFKAKLSGPARRTRQPAKRLRGRRKMATKDKKKKKKKKKTLQKRQKSGASKAGGHHRQVLKRVRR